jgi:hypothetical protein
MELLITYLACELYRRSLEYTGRGTRYGGSRVQGSGDEKRSKMCCVVRELCFVLCVPDTGHRIPPYYTGCWILNYSEFRIPMLPLTTLANPNLQQSSKQQQIPQQGRVDLTEH